MTLQVLQIAYVAIMGLGVLGLYRYYQSCKLWDGGRPLFFHGTSLGLLGCLVLASGYVTVRVDSVDPSVHVGQWVLGLIYTYIVYRYRPPRRSQH